MIPVSELARRLCVASHVLYYSALDPTSRTAPCARHVQRAQALYGLIQPSGAVELGVLIEAATGELVEALDRG